MIYRKIDSYLEYFYRETQMALLLDGARQVGKTTSIRHFGATHFKSFIEINFVRTPEAAGLFRNAPGAEEILTRLSAFADRPLIPGQTLVFLMFQFTPHERGDARKFLSCAEHHREPCLPGIVPTEDAALTAGEGTSTMLHGLNDSRLTRQLKILLPISMT